MRKRTVVFVALLLVAQLALAGSSELLSSPIHAQGGMPGTMGGGTNPDGRPPMQMGSTTRAQREAAAARAAAARQAVATNGSAASPIDAAINWFICLLQGTQPTNPNGTMPMTSGSAAPAAVGPTPDYVGTIANFANSPLPPTVSFLGGGGTGASAIATVQAGVVTAIKVLNGGTGYTTAPSVVISGLDGSGATAHATLTLDAVTAITVDTGGSGYGGIRKFVTKLPGLGAASANELGQSIPVAIADTTT